MILKCFEAYRAALFAKSLLVPAFFYNRMAIVTLLWLMLTVPLALLKLAFPATSIHNLGDALPILVAYSIIIAAPICGYLIAHEAFGKQASSTQLDFHLSFLGKWKRIDEQSARKNILFGPVGFIASLLIGMLLNVVIRAGEFFLAVPAMSAHAPEWGMTLFITMTADVAITGFFYMVAFVMALRTVPLFPRMLLFAWCVDVFMQLIIAQQLSLVGNIPAGVVTPLVDLLQGNMTKVMISIVVWMPYLLLSHRVNITYRHRLPQN
ncbi:DUF2569 domain-containing protein [Pontixanthobacter gangjinensis]|uniref:DUF2569 domain-containing protein n=1 Tax=Pontixanthobacter gangjinensis TaxID=1028742 RepID=A0A6I4SIR5_9SPHN|nr:DUF2569 domain-containing protein [Pontixanthobacter gangjinensis]MXO55268.1 DUF2569 domain-containing protein [Pontixanthobacter gangjinensis]